MRWGEESVDDPRNEKYGFCFSRVHSSDLRLCRIDGDTHSLFVLNSYLQMSAGQPDDDDITWGSDELPIEDMNSKSRDGRSHFLRPYMLLKVCHKLISKPANPSCCLCTDGPIITEDELTSLPLVRVVPDGQYAGQKLNSVVRMMRGLLDQKVPLQEFEV